MGSPRGSSGLVIMSWFMIISDFLAMPLEWKSGILVSFILCGVILYFILKVLSMGEKYQFELVFMDAGVNKHIFTRKNELNFEHKNNSKTYQIKSDRLYRVKPGIMGRLIYKLKGINQGFIVIFQKGKESPVAPVDVKITSNVLGEVRDSRALSKAFKAEFSVPMDLKKILIIMALVVIAVLAFLVMTGQVVI